MHNIRRKPVPIADQKAVINAAPKNEPLACSVNPTETQSSSKPEVAGESLVEQANTSIVGASPDYADDLEDQLEHLQLEPGLEPLDAAPEPSRVEVESQSKLKYALGEVKHFAGGLISHPYEATRHFSILRHSHGLVFYQGQHTSVAITIFADQSLPEDRQVWLQKRGFSGRTGLKIGTLGTRSAWINITPAVIADASALPHNDERAWQRDIQKFLKTAASVKNVCNHQPKETHILRIPHLAEDGYFRVVLCAGRKVMCASPSFRLVSTSTDPSKLRGASFSTIGLEIGAKIGSVVARTTAQTATSGVLQPAVTAYQSAVQPYAPGVVAKTAASTAYKTSLQPKVDQTIQDVDQDYAEREKVAFTRVGGDDFLSIGSDSGPEAPYPIEFSGKVIAGTGETSRMLGRPSANLEGVSQDVELRLSGVYAGWTKLDGKSVEKSGVWMPSLVGVHPRRDVKIGVVERRSIRVMILDEIGDIVGKKLSIMLVAFLHISAFEANPDLEQRQFQLAADISMVEASLSKPAWTAEIILANAKQRRSERSMIEKAADARRYGQSQVDKIPIHRVGVRTDSMGLRDQIVGNGGVCIMR